MINFWVNLSLKFPTEAASEWLNSSCFTLSDRIICCLFPVSSLLFFASAAQCLHWEKYSKRRIKSVYLLLHLRISWKYSRSVSYWCLKFSIFITSLQHFSLFQLTNVPISAHLTWGIWFVMRSYCHDVLSGGAYNQPLLETSTGAGDSALYKIPPDIQHIEGISAAWSRRISWRCRS